MELSISMNCTLTAAIKHLRSNGKKWKNPAGWGINRFCLTAGSQLSTAFLCQPNEWHRFINAHTASWFPNNGVFDGPDWFVVFFSSNRLNCCREHEKKSMVWDTQSIATPGNDSFASLVAIKVAANQKITLIIYHASMTAYIHTCTSNF